MPPFPQPSGVEQRCDSPINGLDDLLNDLGAIDFLNGIDLGALGAPSANGAAAGGLGLADNMFAGLPDPLPMAPPADYAVSPVGPKRDLQTPADIFAFGAAMDMLSATDAALGISTGLQPADGLEKPDTLALLASLNEDRPPVHSVMDDMLQGSLTSHTSNSSMQAAHPPAEPRAAAVPPLQQQQEAAADAPSMPVSEGGSWGASVMDWSSFAFADTRPGNALRPNAGRRASPDAHSSSTKMSSEGSIGSGSASVSVQHAPPALPPAVLPPTVPKAGSSEGSSSGQQLERPKGAPQVDLTKFRTKVCRAWASGQTCQFAERCAFAHGKDQMRSNEEHNPYMDVYGKKHQGGGGGAVGGGGGGGPHGAQTVGAAVQQYRAQKRGKGGASWNTPVGIPLQQRAPAVSYDEGLGKHGRGFVAQQQQQQGRGGRGGLPPTAGFCAPEAEPQFTDQSGCVWFGGM